MKMEKIFYKLYTQNPGIFNIEYTETDKKKIKFILDLIKPKSIIDGGCGLSKILPTLIPDDTQYYGIDIISELIDKQNQATDRKDNCTYLTADITQDKLPTADVIFLSEVIQCLNKKTIQMLFYNIKKNDIKTIITTNNNNYTNFSESVNGFYRQVNLFTGPYAHKSELSIYLASSTYINLITEW